MTTPAQIASTLASRLTQAVPSVNRSAVISTVGPEGSGKTGFALTVSNLGQTVYIPMDRQPAGDYINDQLRERKILVPKTNFKQLLNGKTFDQSVGVKLWTELSGLTQDVLRDRGVRALIWDTSTYAWALLRMARFGKLTQVMPHHYGPVNSEFETLFWLAEENGKIFIAIHKQSKEYKAGKDGKEVWSGRYERAGFSHMGFVANVSLEHFRTEDNGFGVRVLQNKLAPQCDGEELIGDECMLPVLAQKTWGGSLEDYLLD